MRGCTVAVALVACLLVTPAALAAKPKAPPPPMDLAKASAVIPAEWGRIVSATASYSAVDQLSDVTLVMEAPDGTVRVVSLVSDYVTVLARWDRAPAASLAPVLPPQ